LTRMYGPLGATPMAPHGCAFRVAASNSSTAAGSRSRAYEDEIPQHSHVGLGQHPPDVHRNELVDFSKLVEQFFNEIKECALISQGP
jgi:hypothetical protein